MELMKWQVRGTFLFASGGLHDPFEGAGAVVLLAAWPGGACGHQIRTMLVSATRASRRRSGAAHLLHGAPPGSCHPGRAIVTMIVVTRALDAHRAGVKDPGTLSTAAPDPSQRASSISVQRASFPSSGPRRSPVSPGNPIHLTSTTSSWPEQD